jgi:hypothetical protein
MGADHEVLYEASPTYTYEVGGATRRGDRLSLAGAGRADTQTSALADVAERYPLGSAMTIYYDPRDPDRSVVRREVAIVGPIISLVGATIFALA